MSKALPGYVALHAGAGLSRPTVWPRQAESNADQTKARSKWTVLRIICWTLDNLLGTSQERHGLTRLIVLLSVFGGQRNDGTNSNLVLSTLDRTLCGIDTAARQDGARPCGAAQLCLDACRSSGMVWRWVQDAVSLIPGSCRDQSERDGDDSADINVCNQTRHDPRGRRVKSRHKEESFEREQLAV